MAGRAELAWLSGRPAAEISALVTPVYELAVRLNHPWAAGELGQWLAPGAVAAASPVVAEPYRLPPAAAAAAWDRLGCPYEAAVTLLGPAAEHRAADGGPSR